MIRILVVLAVLLAPALGFANVEEKINEVTSLVETIARGVAGTLLLVGIIITGLKFSKGDPDAQGALVKWVIGAALIFASGELVAMFMG